MLLFALVLICGISLSKNECSSSCGEKVTSRDEKTITKEHNKIRNLCMKGEIPGQPRACNLVDFKYDKPLGKIAQQIANKCKFKYSKVKDGRFPLVGENLFLAMNLNKPQSADWKAPLQNWYSEHEDYEFSDDPGERTGHYTQLVWFETRKVGCGYKCFKHAGFYAQLYVCLYGPGGNTRGGNPYPVPDRYGGCNKY